MNKKREELQQNLRKDVEIDKIEKATKRWNENYKKVASHKRSAVERSTEKEID